ncbi:MAG: hypothetical protein KGJ23_14385 [Euryarchaeota archaeon]|nr:hypothetical protein [Euryarchaeota archaeon]MDE1837787.1 hypothetical protein [Euryarchaeota archaeon]MDE1881294.1 hypothetical protein [Euryarchaeota archaeon]MDE2046171.1 hypothetical protein [Thermoplasmata archaeon]
MPSEEYVVLRAVHPSWCTGQLPGEVADLLGCRVQDLEGLQRPGRSIAFLDRGAGTLRVIGTHRSAELFAREMAQNRVVGVAQLTGKLVFNLPDDVERHLAISTYPRGEHGARGTDDTLLWFLPKGEYYEYREVTRGAEEFRGLRSGAAPHVYLAKSLISGLRPPVTELERGALLAAPTLSSPRGRPEAAPRRR